jgi:tRNA uridine 5-carboxymethylaminomethyl modification enzyme
MMTSRAEHRLLLREDNADERVTERGRSLGLVDDRRWQAFAQRRDGISAELERLSAIQLQPSPSTQDRLASLGIAALRKPSSLLELLRRPEVSYPQLRAAFGGVEDALIGERVETQVKYAGYVARQTEEVARTRAMEDVRLPEDLDFSSLAGLSNEVRERLSHARPRSIGQASRIAGVTPAAVSILLVHARARGARAVM